MKKYALVIMTTISVFASAGHAQVPAEEECKTVGECAELALKKFKDTQELIEGFNKKIETAVPRGAVMAFNLASCPTGWKPFEELHGRVVLGAGIEGAKREKAQRTNIRPRRRNGRAQAFFT